VAYHVSPPVEAHAPMAGYAPRSASISFVVIGRRFFGVGALDDIQVCIWYRRRLSLAFPRSAGLLLPSLKVHARHEEPQHRQSFHEEGGGQTVAGQIVCERW
jgi:hypothetical protein